MLGIRTIPKGVERTRTRAGATRPGADYSHGCAENLAIGDRRLYFRRTIPTYVERITSPPPASTPAPAHPHRSGKNPQLFAQSDPEFGPSPPVWGRTYRGGNRPPTSADHPHRRGENMPRASRRMSSCGPSPQAWGERSASSSAITSNGTIPTGVGRTGHGNSALTGPPDHSHRRGENWRWVMSRRWRCGPSPRAWGEQVVAELRLRHHRTIPTGVGRTPAAPKSAHPPADHPHGRGENDST